MSLEGGDQMSKPTGKTFDPIYWKHAVWKAFSGAALVGLGGAPTIVLSWETLTVAGKVVAMIGLLISIIKCLDMFFDTTVSRLAAGKLPVKLEGQNGHDTSHLTKTGVTLP